MIIEIIYRTGMRWCRENSLEEKLLVTARALYNEGADEIGLYIPGDDNYAHWNRGCRKHVYAKTWVGGGTCNLELLHDGPCELKDDNYPGPREMSLTERKKAGWF